MLIAILKGSCWFSMISASLLPGEGPSPTVDGGVPIKPWVEGVQSNLGWGGPNPTLDGRVPIQPWTGGPSQGGSSQGKSQPEGFQPGGSQPGGVPSQVGIPAMLPIPACNFALTSMVLKLQLSSLPMSCSLYSPQPPWNSGKVDLPKV